MSSLIAFQCLIVGLLLWPAVESEKCDKEEIFPFLEFPYFKAHLHVGESMTCRFKSPHNQKADLKWKCMTPGLFEGINVYKRNVAIAKLQRLRTKEILYLFKSNWCSCWIRLHRIDGTVCKREVVQFVELHLPANIDSPEAAKVSIGATKLPWLHNNIMLRGCLSLSLCRDVRYPQNSTEDTSMVLKEKSIPLQKAVRPHPSIVFTSRFLYTFAVLDICKMKKSGLFIYTCMHPDSSRGPEEKMYLNLTWIKQKMLTTPRVSQNPKKYVIEKAKKLKKSEIQKKKFRVITKKAKRPNLNIIHHYDEPNFSPRHQQISDTPRELITFQKAIYKMSRRLKQRIATLDQTLKCVEVAVIGCVLLVLASLAWFYHGTQLRKRYRQSAKCSCNSS